MARQTGPKAITRDVIAWVLIAQTLVILPFISSHPLWLMGLLVACVAWRVWALRRGLLTLRRELKTAAVIVGLLILLFSGYRHYDIDTMVAIVLLGFVLKTLELWRRRDTLMLVFTGFFLCAAQFIYSQSPWQALYALLCVTALCACLVSTTLKAAKPLPHSLIGPLKPVVTLLLLSAPLAVLLFIVVPRIPPLWAIPQQAQATTGISDEITPGDIANLVRSPEDAFRVQFIGAAPQREDWYWRVLVFQSFDGSTWRQGEPLPAVLPPAGWRNRPNFRYRLFVEPTRQDWVPGLDTPTVFDPTALNLHPQRTLTANSKINAVTAYVLSSDTTLASMMVPSQIERIRALQLPNTGNPRLRQWAQQLRASVTSDSAFVDAVLAHIRGSDYFYTLRPPPLNSNHTQDAFWFDTQRGFCSHYASAFVFAMRSAGLPARLVGGYLGGRYNVDHGYITVRQMDAHAWVEVWLEGRGWVRVDPTAAVAPQRVLVDLDELFANEPDLVAELAGRTRHFVPLRRLQLWLDSIEYQWQRLVVQYDEDARTGLMDRWFGAGNDGMQFAILAAAFVAVAALWWGVTLNFTSRSRRSDAAMVLAKLEKKLARRDLIRSAGETVAQFLNRVAQEVPAQRQALEASARSFYQVEYAANDPSAHRAALETLRHTIHKIEF
ncbi:MAG: DUF3488 and transglutaminase-like domain-containing protein [Pseudomonadota bacterium]